MEYRRLTDVHCTPSVGRIQTEKPAVPALLLLLIARCFDGLETRAAWLRLARAAPAPLPAAPVATVGWTPRAAFVLRSVFILAPPLRHSRWL
jgi:hypothetical protein